MKSISISLACGSYDRVRPLLDGHIRTDGGLDIYHVSIKNTPEMFYRSARYHEFDVTEFSFSSYLTSLDSANPPYVAIPVFLSRAFRHGNIYIHESSGIQTPKNLEGKRIGVTEYGTSASVWIRGMLQDQFGVRPEKMEWFSYREEKLQSGRHGVKLNPLPKGKLNQLLENGTLDAVIGSFYVEGKGIRRLFPNYREVEAKYYRETRIFPIMHLVAIKRDIYEKNPWIARTLYKAFCQSRLECLKQFEQTSVSPVMFPWLRSYLDEQRELLGEENIWTYGVDQNLATLEAFARYMYEQGLTSRLITVEEMFVPHQYTNVPE